MRFSIRKILILIWMKFNSHLLRHYEFVTNIIGSKILGKRRQWNEGQRNPTLRISNMQISKYCDMKGETASIDKKMIVVGLFNWKIKWCCTCGGGRGNKCLCLSPIVGLKFKTLVIRNQHYQGVSKFIQMDLLEFTWKYDY